MRAIHVPPRVVIDNHASNTHTVLEVNGRDRPGLLHDVTAAISEQGLQIASAHVTTYGVRAVDVFYVKDVFGLKVENERKLAQLREACWRRSPRPTMWRRSRCPRRGAAARTRPDQRLAATSRTLRAIAAMPLPRLVESASSRPSSLRKTGSVAAISTGVRPE